MKYELNGISLPFGGISWNKNASTILRLGIKETNR